MRKKKCTEAGVKRDTGKDRWDLLPWDALHASYQRAHEAGLVESLRVYSATRDVDALARSVVMLVELAGQEAVVRVLTHGARIYGDSNWLHLDRPKERYLAALWRHLSLAKSIEESTGQPHIAHAACNALFLMHFELHEDGGEA